MSLQPLLAPHRRPSDLLWRYSDHLSRQTAIKKVFFGDSCSIWKLLNKWNDVYPRQMRDYSTWIKMDQKMDQKTWKWIMACALRSLTFPFFTNEFILSSHRVVVPAVYLKLRRLFVFHTTNWAAAPIGRSFATSSWHDLVTSAGDEGSWKMTPALVWRQWPISINAGTESYLLIPPDLAFTGHQPLQEAESNYHHCRQCAQQRLGKRRIWILPRWVWRTSE